MNDYRIWFNVDGYDAIELPVNPQDVAISYPANPSNYDVEGIGEIIVPRIPKLATVSFESFFPREGLYITLANSEGWYSPEWYINFFRGIQKSGLPFELVITRGGDVQNVYKDNGSFDVETTDYYDTAFNAVLLDFTVTDKGGEPGDVYYNMTLSEYRDASPKTLAEIASEDYDDEGNIVAQKLVIVKNRPPQSGAIVSGRSVEINGKVYVTEEQLRDGWNKTKATANQLNKVVSRVLPFAAKAFPALSQYNVHSVYVNGLGWVDKADCALSETKGSASTLKNITQLNV